MEEHERLSLSVVPAVEGGPTALYGIVRTGYSSSAALNNAVSAYDRH